MKRKLSVRLPDGTIATRTTAADYRFVVAVENEAGWGAWSWHGTRDAAVKSKNSKVARYVAAKEAAVFEIIEIPDEREAEWRQIVKEDRVAEARDMLDEIKGDK